MIILCQKEPISRKKSKEFVNTGSVLEWKPKMGGKPSSEEDKKGEKNFLYK